MDLDDDDDESSEEDDDIASLSPSFKPKNFSYSGSINNFK